MEQYTQHPEIAILNGRIAEETNHYYEALTRQKDRTAARNIKLKLNSLYKNLETRILLMGAGSSINR
ncbi:MAG: hypothetical protein K0Q66_1712 [Chitinophagaceae bacterium]|jgi:hypothetical protein|nr:hypothetical protein [Chitinophagaceae bacterium]